MDIIVAPITEAVTAETLRTESIVTGPTSNTVSNLEVYTVVAEVQLATNIVSGQSGPPGPVGLSEDSVAYARQTDFATESLIYKGEADAGSPFSSAVWRIRKIVISSDGDVSETWADGNSNFDNIWDNRASLLYS